MLLFDTICNLATPRMTSALAVVRLSGNDAFTILDKLIYKDYKKLEYNKATYIKIYKDGKNKKGLIDECVVTIFKGPKSYTGFDLVEFTTHGSMIIVDELLATLVSYGARLSKEGEFTYQAYFNNKLNLIQAEKINQVIHAKSSKAKDLALDDLALYSSSSSSSNKDGMYINEIKIKLLKISSNIEYIIEDELGDHSEYVSELEEISKNQIVPLINRLKTIYYDTKRASTLYDGIKVALIGEPNVGKSTLLNKLIKDDKAIVTNIPGTTRDVVEGDMIYKGIYFKLYDTAGIRESDDAIENIGIKKSKEMLNKADIVLFLSETTSFSLEILSKLKEMNKKFIKVLSKTDLISDKNKTNSTETNDISISSSDDESINKLLDLILQKVELDDTLSIGYHLTSRELSYLDRILELLNMFTTEVSKGSNIEILGNLIISAINEINDMLGLSKGQTKEDVYSSIFKNFCLGK